MTNTWHLNLGKEVWLIVSYRTDYYTLTAVQQELPDYTADRNSVGVCTMTAISWNVTLQDYEQRWSKMRMCACGFSFK